MALQWSDLPDFEEVQQSIRDQHDTKARLKVAKLELEIYQARLTQIKPRDASVKLVGVDEESAARLRALFDRIIELETVLEQLDATVKFNDYRLAAAKLISYNGRV